MRKKPLVLLSLCLVVAATTLIEIKYPLENGHSRYARVQERSGVSDSANARGFGAYGKLPLSFEANQGQTDSQVQFLSRGPGYSLFLTSTEAVLNLKKKSEVRRKLLARHSSLVTASRRAADEACRRESLTSSCRPR